MATSMTVRLALLGLLMLAFVVASPWIITTFDFKIFIPMLVASGLITIAAVRLSPGVPASTGLAIVLGLGLVMRALLVFQEPHLSTDIYRYVWDGRVQGAGINPYRYVPADPILTFLRDAAVYPNINRADYAVTAYPPVAQMFFLLVTRLSHSITGMRIAMVLICEGAIVLVMLGLLRRLRLSPVAVVAWVWHPMAIWEISNNGHVDVVMVALMMVGAWLLLGHRAIAGAIAIAMAALVKPYALAVLPCFWRPWNWRLPLAVAATIILGYLPYSSVGWGVFGFVTSTGYLAEEGFASGKGYWLVGLARLLFGPVDAFKPIYLVAAAVALGLLALRIAFREERSMEQSLRDIGWLSIAGLLALSPNYPWYFLAIIPFTVLGIGAPAWALTLGALLLYRPLIIPEHDLSWKTLATLPFVIALIWQARSMRAAHLALNPKEHPDAAR